MHTLLTLAVAGSLLTGAVVAPVAADVSAEHESRMEVQSDSFVQERSHAPTATTETETDTEGDFHILPVLLRADADTEVKTNTDTDAKADTQAKSRNGATANTEIEADAGAHASLWARITAGIKSFFASITHSLNANANVKTDTGVQVK